MRWAYSSMVLSVVLVACVTDKNNSVTDVPTRESDATRDATTIGESGEKTSQGDMATSTEPQSASPEETTARSTSVATASNDELSRSEPNGVGTSTNQGASASATENSSPSANPSGPSSCSSHDDCEANEVCVDSSTKTDCSQGLCTKGMVCGAKDQSVCDPNQPTYTVNDAGEVVPDNRWNGRLCHSCGGLNCAVGGCFRCVSAP
jgi:hypothetical protein